MSAAFSSTMPVSAIRSRRVGRRSDHGTSASTVTGRTTSVSRSISSGVAAVRLTPRPRPMAWISSPSQMLQRTASAMGSACSSIGNAALRSFANRTRCSTIGYHQPASCGFGAGIRPVSAIAISSTVRGVGSVRPSTTMPPRRLSPPSALKCTASTRGGRPADRSASIAAFCPTISRSMAWPGRWHCRARRLIQARRSRSRVAAALRSRSGASAEGVRARAEVGLPVIWRTRTWGWRAATGAPMSILGR